MEEEIRKHFRGVRILVTLALLAAFISFAFTYVLFKEVSVPLERLRTQEYNQLQNKVESFISSRTECTNTRMVIELQLAALDLKQIAQQSSGDLQVQAQKALAETKALLDMILKPPQEQQEPQAQPKQEPEAEAQPQQ
jgi:hypothetical protein